MAYTLEQLQSLTNEEIVKVVATVCHGWHIEVKDGLRSGTDSIEWWKEKVFMISRDDYNPLAHSALGRSQAFELIAKYGIWLSDDADQFGDEPAGWVASGAPHNNDAIVTNPDLQKAVCMASIIAAQNHGDSSLCATRNILAGGINLNR